MPEAKPLHHHLLRHHQKPPQPPTVPEYENTIHEKTSLLLATAISWLAYHPISAEADNGDLTFDFLAKKLTLGAELDVNGDSIISAWKSPMWTPLA